MLSFKTLKNVFVIAEAGVNHNGSFRIAKRLIDVAVDSGADAVKFQIFKAQTLAIKGTPKVKYQISRTGSKESQYEMLKRLELKDDDFRRLADYARRKKIIFLATPFDKESVNLLNDLRVAAFKIPSGEMTNFPLLTFIAKKKKPVILSTGMANLKEIKEALNIIQKNSLKEIVLLHCVTDYPCPAKDINLRAMETLRNTFRLPVGLSDHTRGITIPVAAVALGAQVIEKHFTLDKRLPGPDHTMSLEPLELKEMVRAIREVEGALGNGLKRPTGNEEDIKMLVRKSIVAKVNIPKGSKLKAAMLDIKRPGSGIAPKYIPRLIGRYAKKDIKNDTLVRFEDIR